MEALFSKVAARHAAAKKAKHSKQQAHEDERNTCPALLRNTKDIERALLRNTSERNERNTKTNETRKTSSVRSEAALESQRRTRRDDSRGLPSRVGGAQLGPLGEPVLSFFPLNILLSRDGHAIGHSTRKQQKPLGEPFRGPPSHRGAGCLGAVSDRRDVFSVGVPDYRCALTIISGTARTVHTAI